MKDNQTQILLEGLTADVAAIHKIVSKLNIPPVGSAEKVAPGTSLDVLAAKMEKINELLARLESSKPAESDQQRYINLNILLERIWKRLNPGDSLILHYFTPGRIAAMSVVWLLLFFVMGAAADLAYRRYQASRIEIITNQSTNP